MLSLVVNIFTLVTRSLFKGLSLGTELLDNNLIDDDFLIYLPQRYLYSLVLDKKVLL